MTLNDLLFHQETEKRFNLRLGLYLDTPHFPRGAFADSNSRSVTNRGGRRQRIHHALAGAELGSEKARENLLPLEAD